MTVSQDDGTVEPLAERLAVGYDPDALALLVAAGFGLVAGVLVGLTAALAMASGSAAIAVGLTATVAFTVTTVAVFEAGRRTGGR